MQFDKTETCLNLARSFAGESQAGMRYQLVAKAAMKENLSALVGKVPGLLTMEFVDEPLASSTHDIALVSTLEKAEDIEVYGSHPAHVAVADTYVRPFVTERACLDY